ncbi:MAG: UDP-3-O-[3-hydroxymyristoyl] N-acetylglucosamine deacetylase [Candidatus Rokubacteria bacterium]|nr:UDP-3-O-[3-hydroxymyristoyl] N-acetylglucosamine deacetylase [Candidatus Rokubacteria bacterium]
MDLQLTILKPVSIEGVGLHTGHPARITLLPARADTGIVLSAGDGERTRIPASPDHVVDGRNATTLGINGTRVQTVEHLLAAAVALGIDNLLVDVEGEEIPALDGSAAPFVALLYAAGKATLPSPRRPLVVERPIRVGDEARWLQVLPADRLRISYTLDLDHPAVGTQVLSVACNEHAFVRELAPARTYGFLKDVGALRKNGLAKGGSLDNVVVVGRRSVLNGTLRYRDEFVRHKILDLIGDLALLGRPLIGHVVARNAGHALNHELARAILYEHAESSAVQVTVRALSHPVGRLEGVSRRPLPGLAAS